MDLSQYMLQKSKSLLPITKALNHNITYCWCYPVKLTIILNDTTSMITSLNEGLALLCSWNILPEQEPTSRLPPTRVNTQNDWQTVSYKCKQKSHALWSPLTFKLETGMLPDFPSHMEHTSQDIPCRFQVWHLRWKLSRISNWHTTMQL